MKDSLGDRMKDYENRFRFSLPRRAYTMIRLDGKAFHTYVKKMKFKKPFDPVFWTAMACTMSCLCENIQGCKLGYCQSDEISLVLTDFDDIKTCAWFDGNIQKIVSVSASMATAFFNDVMTFDRKVEHLATFDSRVWSLADPWEVFNTFLWRQKDCTRNSIQTIARFVASHKECHNKNVDELQELIHQKGENFNDYPTRFKRGIFCYKDGDGSWELDFEPPILSQDKQWFFDKVPVIPC